MKGLLSLGDAKAKPGEVAKGSLGSVELADGSRAHVPVIVVNGAEEGPVLTVIAAIHGTEISGIGAIHLLVKSLDPKKLKGALVAVPGGNPLAFRIGVYTTPIDGKNLSGPMYLPPVAKETANITQRMAICINEALEKADYTIDVHANPLPSIGFVLTDLEMCPDERVKGDVIRMAKAFGVTTINWPRKQATSIRDICSQHGKPSITHELPGNIYMWDEVNEMGARGIRNVMRELGMLSGEFEKQPGPIVKGDLTFFGWLRAQRGGFMCVRKEPGKLIRKGETAIEIVNVYGDVIQEVKMPINGYCWSFTGGVHGSHAVSEGDQLAYIFTDVKEIGGAAYVEKPV